MKFNATGWNYRACELHGEQCTHSEARQSNSYGHVTDPQQYSTHSFILIEAIKPKLVLGGGGQKREAVFEHEVERRDAVMEEVVRGGIISQGVDAEF